MNITGKNCCYESEYTTPLFDRWFSWVINNYILDYSMSSAVELKSIIFSSQYCWPFLETNTVRLFERSIRCSEVIETWFNRPERSNNTENHYNLVLLNRTAIYLDVFLLTQESSWYMSCRAANYLYGKPDLPTHSVAELPILEPRRWSICFFLKPLEVIIPYCSSLCGRSITFFEIEKIPIWSFSHIL